MSTDLHTLSGAYALNALSPEEVEQFRRHLDECPACAEEVLELQRVAARMGSSAVVEPPAHLRARVLAAVDRTPQSPPRAGNVVQMPRRTWGSRLLVAAAAAVLVVGGAIGVSQLQGEESDTQLAEGVVRVFEANDANTVTIETANGGRISVATSPDLGQMAVDTDELPELDEEHVYQLWAIQGESVAPVAILEPEKGTAMPMPEPDTEVAITIEPAGGSQQPTTEPILRVNPSSV
jgi:anti-sigma-K factor RskA